MSKVIFLDVDGVLCINGDIYVSLVKNLKKIVERTGAIIVLSSNWRLYASYYKRIVEVLEKYGMKISGHTENINDERPTEIYKWILKNKPLMCVILDDRNLEREKNGHKIKETFIRTHYSTGLTNEYVQKAAFMLNRCCLSHDIHVLRVVSSSRPERLSYQQIYQKQKVKSSPANAYRN